MKMKTNNNLREPVDEYDCWCMPCVECAWWGGDGTGCTHPELWIDPEQNKP